MFGKAKFTNDDHTNNINKEILFIYLCFLFYLLLIVPAKLKNNTD